MSQKVQIFINKFLFRLDGPPSDDFSVLKGFQLKVDDYIY